MKHIDLNQMSPGLQIVKIISRIYKSGMTTTSGGNISILDENGDLWITPSAIDKGSLNEKDIICVKKDGSIIGIHKPSSEYSFHRAIYNTRNDIRTIIHAHPPSLVSFSITRQIPDINIIPQAKEICGSIGFAPYELPGSEELGVLIAEEFKNKETLAVIMENHAVVLVGTDIIDSYARLETLEFCASTIINANTLGKPIYVNDNVIRKYEQYKLHASNEKRKIEQSFSENNKRLIICKMLQRACAQGLMTNTFGNISVRLQNNSFLITPSDILRIDIEPDDIALVHNDNMLSDETSDRYISLHQRIYNTNPHINSIIHTQPMYLMAFATTDEIYNVRTIPESWIFLQDVPKVPFGSQFPNNDTIPSILDENVNAVIISNDSFIVTGDKLIQTFDRLEIAEFSAKSLVMAKNIGRMIPINDEQIEALRKKFLM